MVAMVLEFMVVITSLLSFALRHCISSKVVNGIRFEKLAPTKGASDSLRGRI
jgi:hypothetical protein